MVGGCPAWRKHPDVTFWLTWYVYCEPRLMEEQQLMFAVFSHSMASTGITTSTHTTLLTWTWRTSPQSWCCDCISSSTLQLCSSTCYTCRFCHCFFLWKSCHSLNNLASGWHREQFSPAAVPEREDPIIFPLPPCICKAKIEFRVSSLPPLVQQPLPH